MPGLRAALLVALAGWPAALAAQIAPVSPEPRINWRQDLGFMVEQLRALHPAPFHDVPEEVFEGAAAELAGRIDTLSDWEAALELQRLLALLREGHTGLGYIQPEFGAKGYPIRFQAFSDGILVQAVPNSHRRLLGARLLAVGHTPVDDAVERISEVLSADNPSGRLRQIPFMLSVNIVLRGLGLSLDRDRAEYRLQRRDGTIETVLLEAQPVEAVGAMLEPGMNVPAAESWVRLRDGAPEPEPLWLKRTGELYWHEYLPESRTLYAQINRLYDRNEATFADFTRALFTDWDTQRPQRLVLDLRHNTGGDHIDLPFIHEIVRRAALQERGRLFVVIGRSTFSAAQTFVNNLEEHTQAIFVGEATAQRPNMYGVVGRFTLPSSGLRVSHSRYYIQGVDPADFRTATAPDIATQYTSADHAANRDPALAAALAFRPEPLPNLLDAMRAAYGAAGIEAALAAWRQLAPAHARQGIGTERILAWFGNGLVRQGRTEDAVAVLRANAEAHPASSNALDGLAEALLTAGRDAEAAAAAQAALRLNGSNLDAARVLRLMEARANRIARGDSAGR